MKVLIAKKHGFCFGVEHAIALAEKMLTKGKTVYCLGPLIHNKQVVDRLSESGLKVVSSLDEIPNPTSSSQSCEQVPTVLIRSHGCRPELIEQIKSRGLKLADATCILVKRAQKLVAELHRQGYLVVVVGDPDHPETRGVIGYAPNVTVIADERDFAKLPSEGRLAIISQTTSSPEDFDRIVGLISQRGYSEIKVVNTICRETTRRQTSAIELCQMVDVMFVLGSRHSANTRELARLCRRQVKNTYHLEGWQDFDPQYIEGKNTAGITAGASTPDWIIQEFVTNLQNL